MNNRKLLIPLLLIIALLVVGPAAAQSDGPVEATLIAPETALTVGDPILLTLEVRHPAGYHVIMPELESPMGDFIVHSQSAPVTTAQDDGSEITSQVIDARLFAPGTFSTPPLTVKLTDGAGQVSEVISQPIPLNISSILVEGDTNLRDIKPQVALPYTNLLPWIAGGLVLALILAAAYIIVRRRRARLAFAAIDNRLPHEIALDKLDRVEGLALPDSGRFKEHYSLVSDCMRMYMERRFDVPMLERTTAEIQAGLKRVEIQSSIAGQFTSLLDISDLVKFSKYSPESASAYAVLTSARQIVQATIPQEEPEGSVSEHDNTGGKKTVDLKSGPETSINGKYQQTEVAA